MQDRICQINENLLQRTAGPYMWVMSDALGPHGSSDDVRYAADSDEIAAPRWTVAMGQSRKRVRGAFDLDQCALRIQ